MFPQVILPFLVCLLAQNVVGWDAFCIMTGENGNGNVTGMITLMQRRGAQTIINYSLSNIVPANAKHGFHIHQYGELGNNCLDAGGHYNPTNKTHGDITDSERHVGDFGNIVAEGGNATGSFTAHVVKLVGGTSVIGRSIVIHSGQDDLGRGGNEGSRAAGNSGQRLQCCVILEASALIHTPSIILILLSSITITFVKL